MALQLEGRLKETMERIKPRDQTSARNSAGTSDHLDERLQQLISATLLQATRLAKMEHSCLRNGPRAGMGMDVKMVSKLPEAAGNEHQEQQVPSREGALDSLLAALQQTREELGEVLRSSRQRQLPAGEISILQSVCLSLPLCKCLHISQQNIPSSFFSSALTHSGQVASERLIMQLVLFT